MSESEIETFCAGRDVDYATEGINQMDSEAILSNSLSDTIRQEYGTVVSRETANLVKTMDDAVNASALVSAIQEMDFEEVDSLSELLPDYDGGEDSRDPDMSDVIDAVDTKLTESFASRETSATRVSSKSNRDAVYIPNLVNSMDDGDVFMAKTVGSVNKVRIAWDLNDDNEIIVVDDYDKWEALFGWRKLKELPHGKNKILEELGHKLSDDVLSVVASNTSESASKAEENNTSSGRRTRTKPSDELLNVAVSNSRNDRTKAESETILESFQDSGDFHGIEMLILFPTTTDMNMSDHWYVPGKRWPGGGSAAIANCNKGTFEYLNQLEQVWHIEDYLEQASGHIFETNKGAVTLDSVDESKLVIHVCTDEMYDRLKSGTTFRNMPEVLPDYCNDHSYRTPDPERWPHPDDMFYAPMKKEDVFWIRPELRESDAIVAYGESSPRDMNDIPFRLSSGYELYARARLPDWEFDSVEMLTLDNASYKLDLSQGGYEIVETLGLLHDEGHVPYSKTPKSRWD